MSWTNAHTHRKIFCCLLQNAQIYIYINLFFSAPNSYSAADGTYVKIPLQCTIFQIIVLFCYPPTVHNRFILQCCFPQREKPTNQTKQNKKTHFCSSAFVSSKPRLAVGQLGLLLHSPNCHTERLPFLIKHTDFTVPFLICDVSWQKRIVMEENWLHFPVHDWKYCSNSSFSISSKMDVLFLEVSPWSVVATIHHVAAVLTNYFLHVPKEGGVM